LTAAVVSDRGKARSVRNFYRSSAFWFTLLPTRWSRPSSPPRWAAARATAARHPEKNTKRTPARRQSPPWKLP